MDDNFRIIFSVQNDSYVSELNSEEVNRLLPNAKDRVAGLGLDKYSVWHLRSDDDSKIAYVSPSGETEETSDKSAFWGYFRPAIWFSLEPITDISESYYKGK